MHLLVHIHIFWSQSGHSLRYNVKYRVRSYLKLAQVQITGYSKCRSVVCSGLESLEFWVFNKAKAELKIFQWQTQHILIPTYFFEVQDEVQCLWQISLSTVFVDSTIHHLIFQNLKAWNLENLLLLSLRNGIKRFLKEGDRVLCLHPIVCLLFIMTKGMKRNLKS